jgi:hypothetical protein
MSAQPDPLARALVAALDNEALADLAKRLAPHLPARDPDPWLTPAGVARHLNVTVRRVHDLKSSGRLVADGADGRVPLFRLSTVDQYARARR